MDWFLYLSTQSTSKTSHSFFHTSIFFSVQVFSMQYSPKKNKQTQEKKRRNAAQSDFNVCFYFQTTMTRPREPTSLFTFILRTVRLKKCHIIQSVWWKDSEVDIEFFFFNVFNYSYSTATISRPMAYCPQLKVMCSKVTEGRKHLTFLQMHHTNERNVFIKMWSYCK